jgi:hypothetical protein
MKSLTLFSGRNHSEGIQTVRREITGWLIEKPCLPSDLKKIRLSKIEGDAVFSAHIKSSLAFSCSGMKNSILS